MFELGELIVFSSIITLLQEALLLSNNMYFSQVSCLSLLLPHLTLKESTGKWCITSRWCHLAKLRTTESSMSPTFMKVRIPSDNA
jgi:hypothetical protein